MLKKLWIPVILCIIVSLTGCDQGKQMMEQPLVDPSISETDEQPMYPEITFENVLDLAPEGRYRMRPTGSNEVSEYISRVDWGSVDIKTRELREEFTDDDPKIFAAFYFDADFTGNLPFSETLDGKKVIERDPVWDEIVIEIVGKAGPEVPEGHQEIGGPRGNRFEFTLVEYTAILIENLTHPDREIVYREDE